MLQVGVTGGIGSGKSTVCKIFQSLGIPVYDADSRAKKLMQENGQLVHLIKNEFGNDSYLASGEINRDYLAKVAFADPEKVKKLNALVHPVVADDYSKWVSDQTANYVVKEAALLIESGSYLQLDKLIAVTAPTQLRIARIKSRDSFRSQQEIEAIIANQLSDEERESKADFIIKNDESELLIAQVLRLDKQFRQS
ncbi:dephospho-CoA kinase [Reichenbachiella sp. MALMAid0571]|uniref:dephospho-CoA kinase n=1 Tax=Reichenbachiella sp. MALMAid0571 TaxID=3143939 RepID=UPI0032E005F5